MDDRQAVCRFSVLTDEFLHGPPRIAARPAQHCVYQRGRGHFAAALGQLHTFVDCGVRGDAIEKSQLVQAHPQRYRHFRIEPRSGHLQISIQLAI